MARTPQRTLHLTFAPCAEVESRWLVGAGTGVRVEPSPGDVLELDDVRARAERLREELEGERAVEARPRFGRALWDALPGSCRDAFLGAASDGEAWTVVLWHDPAHGFGAQHPGALMWDLLLVREGGGAHHAVFDPGARHAHWRLERRVVGVAPREAPTLDADRVRVRGLLGLVEGRPAGSLGADSPPLDAMGDDAELWREALDACAADASLELDVDPVLAPEDGAAFRAAVRAAGERPVDALLVFGHGADRAGEWGLAVGAGGAAVRLGPDDLAAALRADPPPRFVLLAACCSGFDLAPALVAAGVSDVLAIGKPISAIALESLATGLTRAVLAGRDYAELLAATRRRRRAADRPHEWWSIQHWTDGGSARLFDPRDALFQRFRDRAERLDVMQFTSLVYPVEGAAVRKEELFVDSPLEEEGGAATTRDALLDGEGDVVLEGRPGVGKTMLLRRLASEGFERGLLPVLVRVPDLWERTWNPEDPTRLRDVVGTWARDWAVLLEEDESRRPARARELVDLAAAYERRGRLLVLLDGFDEALWIEARARRVYERVEEIRADLSTARGGRPGGKLVVASRSSLLTRSVPPGFALVRVLRAPVESLVGRFDDAIEETDRALFLGQLRASGLCTDAIEPLLFDVLFLGRHELTADRTSVRAVFHRAILRMLESVDAEQLRDNWGRPELPEDVLELYTLLEAAVRARALGHVDLAEPGASGDLRAVLPGSDGDGGERRRELQRLQHFLDARLLRLVVRRGLRRYEPTHPTIESHLLLSSEHGRGFDLRDEHLDVADDESGAERIGALTRAALSGRAIHGDGLALEFLNELLQHFTSYRSPVVRAAWEKAWDDANRSLDVPADLLPGWLALRDAFLRSSQ